MLARELSSLQHPIVKHFVKLREDKEYRASCKHVVISGLKLIHELSSLFSFKTLLVEKGYRPSFAFKADELIEVTPEILKKIAHVASVEPVIAEIAIPASANLKGLSRILVLDGISDPGNLGTLLRSGLALGWEGAFLTPGTTDPFNEKALRAAKGATFKLPIQQGSYEELKSLNLSIFAADPRGVDVKTIATPQAFLLALGNEAHGVHPNIKDQATLISIPMHGPIESLNVASAGAILMYLLNPGPS